ncbi:MAG TPA: AbrB/MazE/SpoVT family DNA-binding domain-containing protein [bacterium]|nr:AbrB/MazE/SpoVT family DNA-binding domain-containing protein [bacterium]
MVTPPVATVTRKGQITLPKAARDALALGPGAQVDFEVRSGAIILRKRVTGTALDRWRGFLKRGGKAARTDVVIETLRGK